MQVFVEGITEGVEGLRAVKLDEAYSTLLFFGEDVFIGLSGECTKGEERGGSFKGEMLKDIHF